MPGIAGHSNKEEIEWKRRMKSGKKRVKLIGILVIIVLITTGAAMVTWELVLEKAASGWESAFVMGELSYQSTKELQKREKDMSKDMEKAKGFQELPDRGIQYGELICEESELYAPVYYGDTDEILDKGAGTYEGFGVPGQGKTILIGAHDGTYFHTLDKLNPKDVIQLKTAWGMYSYEVEKSLVAKVTDTQAYMENTGETLVLYTCYPIGEEAEERTERYFVCAKLIEEEAE